MKNSIGHIIEMEVRKQRISINEFADSINCKRNNVYNIFKRSDMSIQQLKIICKVLKKNFFLDLAMDSDLVQIQDEINHFNNIAVGQFLELVPKVLKDMNKSCSIIFFSDEEVNEGLPDFGIMELGFTFTIDGNLSSRIKKDSVKFNIFTDSKERLYELSTSNNKGTNLLNIPIKYYTEEEWSEILKYAFKISDNLNLIQI